MDRASSSERNPADVVERATELYGSDPRGDHGVVHVVSAVRGDDDRYHVLKIGPHAPQSSTDFFVLNLWRAKADAILSTGQLLRDEPHLSHALSGPWAEALTRYRREVLRKTAPSVCAILTRRGELPLDRPLWADDTRKLVLTGDEVSSELSRALAARAEIVSLPQLSARVAIDWLAQHGAKTILVEAGPSTAQTLYEAPSAIDALCLSCCQVEGLDPRVLGKALPDDGQLFSGLVRKSDSPREEESGPWRFQRYVRA